LSEGSRHRSAEDRPKNRLLGFAELKKGSAAAGNADIAAARAVNPKIADKFLRYGVK
jgi:hypothetical protein